MKILRVTLDVVLTIALVFVLLALCASLKELYLTANAAELPEPQAVGVLKIPAVLREYTEPELSSNLQVVSSKIDNERVLAEKTARWENQRAQCVESVECVEPESEPEPEMTYLGSWKVTGYDLCARCCGNTRGLTASGEKAEIGVTCAGPRSLPFGTRIWIEGIGERIVQDRGGAVNGNHIDVLCSNHAECYAITGTYDIWAVVEP